MSSCSNSLSTLQRQAFRKLSAPIMFTALLNIFGRYRFGSGEAPLPGVILLAFLYVLPVAAAVLIIGRYLAAEPDEFVRALVVRALLWGLAITMAGDAVAGVLIQYYATPLPIAMLNVDTLFFSTGIAFRLLQRSYR